MQRCRRARPARSALLVVLVLAASMFMGGGTANAAPTPVGLGTATSFAIRAGSGVSNVPTSAITGDVGLRPGAGTLYTGLTCAEVTGTIYKVDATGLPCATENAGLMTTVENDARAAFNNTSALPGATPIANPDLVGQNLVAGLYSFGAAATNLSGALTLNAQGDPSSVWIFQASSSLITSVGSTMGFTNLPPGVTAAQLACNVFWTVGSDATINGATFVGTILASGTITVGSGATVTGRLLAANAANDIGAVTLIMDTIIRPPGCPVLPAGTGGTPAVPPGTPGGPPGTPGGPPGTPGGPPGTPGGPPGTPGGPPGTPGGPPAGPPSIPATPVGSPPNFTG